MSDIKDSWIPVPPPADNNIENEEVVTPIWEFWINPNEFKTNIKLQEHSTDVDENYFLSLLAWSISLSIEEKKKIIENFWSLNQFQVDELIKIFEEEKEKFSALDIKHKEQLDKMQNQHMLAWEAYELEEKQKEDSIEEEEEVEDIRKSLWL